MTAVRLAYLVNQYPQPSQAFIRREIAAIEAAGVPVSRFTLRRFDGKLADPADEREREQTTAVLSQNKAALLKNVLADVFTGGFWKALGRCWTQGTQSGRGRLVHLVYLVEACTLRRLLAAENIEHVHCHFGTNAPEVALLTQMLGGPGFSFTVHGPEEFDRPQQLDLGGKTAAARFVCVVSSFGRSQLWRWANASDWSKVKVVHCGVDGGYLDDEPAPPSESRDFVCIGRLAEQKGQHVLIDAARLLCERGIEFHVHLLGEGPMRGELESAIKRHDLGRFITLHGLASGEQVQQHLRLARAMVMPSFAEGLPVVLMESLAMGRPAISTYIAGIPELICPGETGWLVPAGDAGALADAMEQALLADEARLKSMGEAGRTAVAESHDADREAGKILGHIEASLPVPASASAV